MGRRSQDPSRDRISGDLQAGSLVRGGGVTVSRFWRNKRAQKQSAGGVMTSPLASNLSISCGKETEIISHIRRT